jgi:TonB family protein
MSYLNRQIHMDFPPDANLGWMMILSFFFHGLLFLAVLGLSTLTFGSGPYIPTIYQVELVSLSTQPFASPSPPGYKVKMPSLPEPALASPVMESPSEPTIVVPKQDVEKKRIEPKEITRKRALEEVKKPPPKKEEKVEKKKSSPPPEQKISRPEEKTESTPDAEKKLEEIRKRLLAAQDTKSGDQAKSDAKDDSDVQILGGASGGSWLGRAHFGAVANLQMKVYLNQVREKIEAALVWPSALEADENLVTRASLRIAREGKILKFQIEETSGNSFFDDAVLRAIKKADPLPPLPDSYQENVLEILCAFHSKNGR